MQLYEITENLKQINEMIDQGADPDQLQDALGDVNEAFEEKAKHILFVMRNLQGSIELCKSEEKRLSENRKAMENQLAGIKEYLILNMKESGITKVDNGVLKASYVKPKPMLVLSNEDSIPDEYKKIKVSSAIDKKMLLDALKDGGEVEGAEIGESKPSLMIK
jgi:hypothetical protein